MWPTPTGALNQLYAGTSDEALELNGKVRNSIHSFDIHVFLTLYP
jgi:hypothetical protein